MAKRDKDIKTLKSYYAIKGDGIASLKVERLVEDDDFQQTLAKLAAFKLKKERDSEAVAGH